MEYEDAKKKSYIHFINVFLITELCELPKKIFY